MTINFPQSPVNNEIYSFKDKIYKWNGKKWIIGPIENNSLISSEFTDYIVISVLDNKITLDTRTYNFFEVDLDNSQALYEIDILSSIATDNFVLKVNIIVDPLFSISWPINLIWTTAVPSLIENSTQIIEFYKFDNKIIADVLYNG